MKNKVHVLTLAIGLFLLPSTGIGMHKDSKVMSSEIALSGNSIDDAAAVRVVVNIQELVAAWQQFLADHPWQDLIKNCTPIVVGCGTVYDLPNFLNRPYECFAIVDMGAIRFAEPHYHPENDYEIYFVLRGSALVVIAGCEYRVQAGDTLVIPPQQAHFTIPDKDYVIACVNTPPYDPERYIVLTESNAAVGFDQAQFDRLVQPEA